MVHVSFMVHVGYFYWIVQNGSGTGWPATCTSIRSLKLCVGLIVQVGLVVHMLAYFRNQRIGEECTKLSQLNRLVVTGMQITMKENGDITTLEGVVVRVGLRFGLMVYVSLMVLGGDFYWCGLTNLSSRLFITKTVTWQGKWPLFKKMTSSSSY